MISLCGGVEFARTSKIKKISRIYHVLLRDKTIEYSYNASGLRVSKTTNGSTATHILDGSNIVAELDNAGAVKAIYIRGINLIYTEDGAGTKRYYLFNAHGDVVQLTGNTGTLIKAYDYDAFGNEASPDPADTNPFRYCGEYFDKETGTIYLRARYYDPKIGRFLSKDTHWNPSNMIYGDYPIKRNERQLDQNDSLGLNTYTYVPDITVIIQSGNLYVYCMNNPIGSVDSTGELAYPGQIHNLVVNHMASKYGYYTEQTIDYNYSILWGRADLISTSGEVWDVKRDKPRQIAGGVAQVSIYTQNTWKRSPNTQLSVGGYVDPDSFVFHSGPDTYYVSYRYAGEGVIAYDYTKVTNWQQVGKAAIGIVLLAGAAYLIVQTGGAAAPVLVLIAAKALGG